MLHCKGTVLVWLRAFKISNFSPGKWAISRMLPLWKRVWVFLREIRGNVYDDFAIQANYKLDCFVENGVKRKVTIFLG